MAIHKDLGQLAREAVDEYLAASANCLSFRKPDGGCLGYPATLLLLYVVNALGICLDGESVPIDGHSQRITGSEPFLVLNHECFALGLNLQQIKLLERSYRNRLAHSAIIDVVSFSLPLRDDPPFVFGSGLVGIKVFSFYEHVARAYSQFPKERIHSWAERLQNSTYPIPTLPPRKTPAGLTLFYTRGIHSAAFSKRFENRCYASAIYRAYYHFCRVNQTLRVTPAMEAGLADHIWSLEELVSLLSIDSKEVALHSFPLGSREEGAEAGVMMDKAGNLVGTTIGDGGTNRGREVVHKLAPQGKGKWKYTITPRLKQGRDPGHSPGVPYYVHPKEKLILEGTLRPSVGHERNELRIPPTD